MAVRVEYHPRFAGQYDAIAELAQTSDAQGELFAEVTALVSALEEYGHGIEEDNHHPDAISHPIVTSRFHTFALRRTPPTKVTPYAERPPVLRIPYVWFNDSESGDEVAVVMLAGDKTALGNDWYPGVVNQIDNSMVGDWERTHPTHKARVRRTR
jgi:hypothetical protein